MRLTRRLIHIAGILVAATVAGCGGNECVGSCTAPPTVTKTITAGAACSLLDDDLDPFAGNSPACAALCGDGYRCLLPDSFTSEVHALNPNAATDPPQGGWPDGGRMLACPTSPATLAVTCAAMVVGGRRTEGCHGGEVAAGTSVGDRLAALSWLEAVSVHAFDRLERELAAHGARPRMLRDARKAKRDEVRHTRMTSRLARRYGGTPRMPDAPAPVGARPLVEIAIENAVEGCVRETYGAVQALVEGRASPDRAVRALMKAIAPDECRHAELAWNVHRWAMPQLTAREQRRVTDAMRAAAQEIARTDAQAASLLFGASSAWPA